MKCKRHVLDDKDVCKRCGEKIITAYALDKIIPQWTRDGR